MPGLVRSARPSIVGEGIYAGAVPLLRPFRALRYGSDHLHLLGRLVSPSTHGEPVDRQVVGDVHPWNVRQLVRGDRGPRASADEPEFTHAARLLQHWKEEGIVVRDPRPGLYVYEQEDHGGKLRGVVGLVRLSPLGSGPVLPHEATRGGSSETLRAQLQATRTQLSLVMALVPDSSGALGEFMARADRRPSLETTDGAGRHNRIWSAPDPDACRQLGEALHHEVAVIADGHHRYEAALLHQADRTGSRRRDHPADFVMVLLVPASDPGLRCEPAHRVCPSLPRGLPIPADRHFDLIELPTDDALFDYLDEPGERRFGMVWKKRRLGLRLRYDVDSNPALSDLPEVLRRIDAAVLDRLMVGPLRRAIGDSGASGSAFGHNSSSGREIVRRAMEGEIDLALVVRPPTPGQVLDVALEGVHMPAKSSNFAPKPTKGLLMNSLVSF
jgi:uncharacterized protein (DUF1015 family)